MKSQLSAIAFSLLALHSASIQAAAVGATWTSRDTTAKTITGMLGPAAISITNISAPSISSAGNDFSGANYSAAPLSSSGPAISNYEVGSNYTVTFSLPVSGLMIYGMNWRGNAATPYIYTFNHPVAIISAFDTSTASGNALTISSSFDDGIIRFSEPVKTLTVKMNTSSTGGQIMTFGVVPITPTATLKGSAKPKTKAKFYTLRGTADATYGIKTVTIKVGKKNFKARGTATWSYRVKLTGKRTKVHIQATSNTGEKTAIKRVTITQK
jgi:hypothetical protein